MRSGGTSGAGGRRVRSVSGASGKVAGAGFAAKVKCPRLAPAA